MQKNILFVLFTFLSISTFSQDTLFCGPIEIRPQYKGGEAQLLKDIKQNLIYPGSGCVQGKAFVSFIVDSTGKVIDTKIVKGINEVFDNEALRVVKLLDNWTPGELRGKKVNTKFIIPISFKVKSGNGINN